MKKVKAFTLIECLVAMLILAVSSLPLVQGYTQLMKITKRNNTIYTSIADQMNDVETKENTNSYKIGSEAYVSTNPATKKYVSGRGKDLVLVKAEVDTTSTNGYKAVTTNPRKYKNNVTVVANYSYEQHNIHDDNEKNSDKGTDMRYIYFYR